MSAAIAGAPITIPAANTDVERPAVPTETLKYVEMSGLRPASMNSEVPMAKATRARR